MNFCNISKRFFMYSPKICKDISRKHDMIGPPDPISNLRPIKFKTINNPTETELKYRRRREEVQKWNEDFWTRHNTDFFREKELFIKKESLKKNSAESNLNADEMSVFYKEFLDRNWSRHLNYNFQWYRKNIELLLLALQVNVESLFRIKNKS